MSFTMVFYGKTRKYTNRSRMRVCKCKVLIKVTFVCKVWSGFRQRYKWIT